MTKFEAWKRSLTPEDLFIEGYHAGEPFRSFPLACKKCPAETCKRKDLDFIGRDAICAGSFLDWANAESGPVTNFESEVGKDG